MISRALFSIGVLLLLVAAAVWLLNPGSPGVDNEPAMAQDTVPPPTIVPLATTATPRSQLITIDTPAQGAIVGSPVVLTGHTAEYPTHGQLHYRILAEDGSELNADVFAVTGAPNEPTTFTASLTFREPIVRGRVTIELLDRDASTDAVLASASINLNVNPPPIVVIPANLELAPQIVIESPASGSDVFSPVVITGYATAYPAQGKLNYRVADVVGNELGAGMFAVRGIPGQSVTFETSITYNLPSAGGPVRIEVFDQEPTTGVLLARTVVDVIVPVPVSLTGVAVSALVLDSTPLAGMPIVVPTSTTTPLPLDTTMTPPATVAPAPSAIILAECPRWIDVGASDSISLTLKWDDERGVSVVSTDPDHAVVAETVAMQPLGSGYNAAVQAKLIAPAFDVQSAGDVHSLDQNELTWQWGITPKRAGTQKVIIIVDGNWRPQSGGQTIERNLWRREFTIEVHEPIFSLGQISLASLASGLAGSMLSVPWIVDQVRAWRKQRQSAKQTRQQVT